MSVRVRFAPSPTGALHIGGVRTALYNYLFAKKHHGTFILRIEDTDQNRLVEGAEEYIMDALRWAGLDPDESPDNPGDYGPYRQSERLDIYRKYAGELIESGKAYYAFDTPDALENARKNAESSGGAFLYGSANRLNMHNSLSMSPEEVKQALDAGEHYVIRLKVEADEVIEFTDLIRGQVQFSSNELDDKVLMKGDGFPTYHLANIIDDFLMRITHVIRGEEWLSSTAHHILLYRAFGWEDQRPAFSHLPLILKPSGNGKLSKRDGDKLGIPVFPLSWEHPDLGKFFGFREAGFLPEAMLNFIALLGWSPGENIEMMNMGEMIDHFSIEKIGKSGSRFDFDKAQWFNQKYIMQSGADKLALLVEGRFREAGYQGQVAELERIIDLFKERVNNINDFVTISRFIFSEPESFDTAPIIKKWNDAVAEVFLAIIDKIRTIQPFQDSVLEPEIKGLIEAKGVGLGSIFPALRVALAGTAKGPDLFTMMELMGRNLVERRLENGFEMFNNK